MQSPTLRLFPGGKQKALTLSYDDGDLADKRLIGIFDRHGLKATFHLNSGLMGDGNRIPRDEIAEVYRNHEVSTHSATHPSLTLVPHDTAVAEITMDRMALETITGYPVRGHSYPNGDCNEQLANLLGSLGIVYARTIKSHGAFHLPENPLLWHPTCHHEDKLLERTRQFIDMNWGHRPQLFYVWGHSFEFNRKDNWSIIEEFAETIGGNDSIWYATNIEIIDYLTAFHRLVISLDGTAIHNPSAIPVWVETAGQSHEIQPGQTLRS